MHLSLSHFVLKGRHRLRSGRWLCSLLATQVLAMGQSTQQALIQGFWYAGAEVNRYDLSQNCYGAQHSGHCEFIFVTEPFATQAQVKNESGTSPGFDVLKLNALRSFHTGLYSYRSMVSTFQPVDFEQFPDTLKSNASIQDWCGQSFQQLNRHQNGWRSHLFSYFQAMGDQVQLLQEAYLEDALWLLVRLNPAGLPQGEMAVIPGAFHARLTQSIPQVQRATGYLDPGEKRSTYSLVYQNYDRELHIEFDSGFPHIIRAWQSHTQAGTTRAVLTQRWMHCNYWEHHKPHDRSLRRRLGLDPVCD